MELITMKNLWNFITDKQNRKFVVFTILTVCVMVAIFLFSAQNGEESGALSGRVEKLLRLLLGETIFKQWLTGMWLNVRKFAHVFIYALLGFCACSTANNAPNADTIFRTRARKIGIVLLFCLLYACSDEFHQTFVPGRAGSFKDVCVDAVGFIPATIITAFVSGSKCTKKAIDTH